MCSGQTVHWVNCGPPLTLRAGELLFLNQHAVHQVERAGAEDVGVNFIVLPQFFDYALELIGTHNVLGNFLLSGLRQQGGGISFLHFQVRGCRRCRTWWKTWWRAWPSPSRGPEGSTRPPWGAVPAAAPLHPVPGPGGPRPGGRARCSPPCGRSRRITGRRT